MKRPPGLWILLSAGVLWLSLKNANGIRATSLIFSKSTSTTTETPGEEATAASATDEETATEVSPENSNTTKPTLTGNPQLDYVYDPNLPQELNGYNLSDYPFYERVPEDIDFKCDGLHDGFYASVPHKCQVYHHCLFGTRFDFLCANYTAFDQKTFICHFVSEVDCVNSKKFWHRNDALYKAVSTTTIKPPFVHTPPPQPPPILSSASIPVPRPNGGRIRPMRKRRPYDYYEYDEYDDYYDERPRPRRRKRPRPRRPVYDEEYEYEDDRYEKRGSGRREEDHKGRPYDRRNDRRRNKDRRPYDDDLEEYDSIDVSEDRRRNPDDDIRRPADRRKPSGDRYHKRRPIDDDYDRFERPRKAPRRPVYEEDLEDEYEEDLPQATRRSSEKPRRGDATEDNKPITKPVGGSSIYDRPRTAPKIKPPVPKHEVNKYAFKSTTTQASPKPGDEESEYYDDYEEEPAPKSTRKPEASTRNTNKYGPSRDDTSNRKGASSRHRTHSVKRPDYVEEDTERPTRNRNKGYRYRPRNGERNSPKRRPSPEEEYYDDYEVDPKENQNRNRNNKNDQSSIRNDDNRKGLKSTHEERGIVKEESSTERGNKSPEIIPSESPNREEGSREDEPVSPREEQSNFKHRGFLKYDNPPKKEKVTTEENSSTNERNNESNEDAISNTDNSRPNGRERVHHRNKYTNFRERVSTTTPAPILSSTSTEALPREKPDHVVRIVKRPFLPSRGGNPYFARGLQAVGIKATEKPSERPEITARPEEVNRDDEKPSENENQSKYNGRNLPESIQDEIDDEEYTDEPTEKPFKPNPILLKVPIRKTPINNVEQQQDLRPFTSRPLSPFRNYNNIREYEGPRTTQEPKIDRQPEQRNPLDINENEYDVTLNDALNPTLPNLPVRGLPTGFSPANDYSYSNFRPRYVIDPVLTPSSSDIVYQQKAPPRQRYEAVAQTFANTNNDYKGQYSTLNSQISQPRVLQHAQTQAFYTGY